jgi:hypothetical protein
MIPPLVRSVLAMLLFAYPAASQTLPFPADVSTRVGRAAEFVYDYSAQQYADGLPSYDVVWSNVPGSRQGGAERLYFPRGSFSGAYFAVNRVPAQPHSYGRARIIAACGVADGGCPLSWFQKEHPEWIIYRSDKRTPAWQYDDKATIPLDISNPDVQHWIEANVFQPIIDQGYQALSVDNVTNRNDFDEVGTCSVKPDKDCLSSGGRWTQLYSGERYKDAKFLDNRVAWAREISAWLHAHAKSSMANITFDPYDMKATARLVDAFDVWYDEQGFTGDGNPSPCNPSNPSGSVGKDWIQKVAFITGLNGGAGPRAYVAENSICPLGAPRERAFEVVEFAVATYLIAKNSHTYMTMYFAGDGGAGGVASFNADRPGEAWPQFYLTHGLAQGPHRVTGGIYHREFAQALALVNPQTRLKITYDLGNAQYYRSDCRRYTGKISMGPTTGMVLLKSAPDQCK